MSVVLIDTSVFCNIVPVPGFDQSRDEVLREMEDKLRARATLLLPMAAIIETGNHIAHVGDGRKRRSAADAFSRQVKDAIDGRAPWTPTQFWDLEAMRAWLDDFPESAQRKQGLGDLSIIREWQRQCELHKARRVGIWSLDGHLKGYDRLP